jgi:hypothetical protein
VDCSTNVPPNAVGAIIFPHRGHVAFALAIVELRGQNVSEGTKLMHAAVVHVQITDTAEAKRGVEEEVLPTLTKAPGFIAAYYVAVDDSHGVSIEVFQTEDQAKAVLPTEGAEAPGVRMTSIEVGEVLASA